MARVPSGLSHKRRPDSTFLRVMPLRLVQYRELRKVSKTALAKEAGISRSTMNAIESGQATDMNVTTLERLCHALGVSADALLGYDPKLGSPRICPVCGKQLASRALHLPGDCMMTLSLQGTAAKRIGEVFGLSVPAIEVVLREEHEARRRRRF